MFDFAALKAHSPILLRGSASVAYRDPAVFYRDGTFYLYMTCCTTKDHTTYLQLGMTTSCDLIHFSPTVLLTPQDTSLNYSSPGNVVCRNGQYLLCCQTYCRENGERWGNERSRIHIMSSTDLVHWSAPRLLRVKGPDVPEAQMGRMIDPYLIQNDAGEWYCFYKQNGVSFSRSRDLETWEYAGRADSGENVCIIRDGDIYRMWDSPANGIGEKISSDLLHWQDTGRLLTFGQAQWPWAQGRLTAGFVLDLRSDPEFRKALIFFHGTGPLPEEKIFNNYASLSVAWSGDLEHWEYPVGSFGRWEVDPACCTGA